MPLSCKNYLGVGARPRWLTAVILAITKQRSGGQQLKASPGQIIPETLTMGLEQHKMIRSLRASVFIQNGVQGIAKNTLFS
jgi:hypothetical protein